MELKNNYVLCLSSIISGYNLRYVAHDILRNYGYFLMLTSLLFWSTGQRGTFFHTLDLFVARTFVPYAFFLMFMKERVNPLLVMIVALSYYGSRTHSTKKWLCKEHVFFHAIFHISAMYTILKSEI